jgi:hypothetical protein
MLLIVPVLFIITQCKRIKIKLEKTFSLAERLNIISTKDDNHHIKQIIKHRRELIGTFFCYRVKATFTLQALLIREVYCFRLLQISHLNNILRYTMHGSQSTHTPPPKISYHYNKALFVKDNPVGIKLHLIS